MMKADHEPLRPDSYVRVTTHCGIFRTDTDKTAGQSDTVDRRLPLVISLRQNKRGKC
jgi:hypothetical protein